MRIAILSDLHLVSPSDPLKEVHARRAHFARAWPSAKRMCARLREAAPDLVVSLGDLVDWYSDENRDFAIDILNELKVPWIVTPGNHDFQMYASQADGTVGDILPARDCEEEVTRRWHAAGIELGNRMIEAGNAALLLVNSACGTVPEGTREWLDETLGQHSNNFLFTHTPLDIPPIRRFILSVDRDRDLKKYVQNGASWLFADCLRDRFQATFFGHLHFAGQLCVDSTTMYFLGLSVAASGRQYRDMGQAMICDLDGSKPQVVSL